MRRFSMPIPHSLSFAVASVAAILGCSTAAMAQTVPGPSLPITVDSSSLARIAADLAYPNSAQRFFEAGKAQFEEEIKRLTDEDIQSDPLLTIRPEVLDQFEDE